MEACNKDYYHYIIIRAVQSYILDLQVDGVDFLISNILLSTCICMHIFDNYINPNKTLKVFNWKNNMVECG